MTPNYRQVLWQKGFTLLELMVVILIIGISTSMAMLFIDTSDERLKHEAQRLLAMTQYARDEAVITGESLGLVIRDQEYFFTRLEKDKWIQIEHKPFRVFEIRDDIQIRSLIARQHSGDAVQQPDQEELIYFLPTGESSEFQIWLSNDNESEFVLNSTFMGELSLDKTER